MQMLLPLPLTVVAEEIAVVLMAEEETPLDLLESETENVKAVLFQLKSMHTEE